MALSIPETVLPFKGDVGIKDGRIAALGKLGDYADSITDAKGMPICPGFVDLHTHTDTNFLQCPEGDSRIFQGITTDAGGNCGDSPFPAGPYSSAAVFMDVLKKQKIGINYCSFTGQGSIRSAVIGDWNAPATREQIKAMQDLLEKQLEEGSIGISCGLEYAPGAYATNEELVELLKLCQSTINCLPFICATKTTGLSRRTEAISMAGLRARLQISHLSPKF